MKKRLDLILLDRGLVATREKAQALIIAGQVLVNDTPECKPGKSTAEDAPIRIRGDLFSYVSRGALKLKKAIEYFQIDVSEKIAIDVGASTGGFTEVLIENGAKKIFALDVGHSQLDWKIRSHPKVVVIEKTNARNMPYSRIGQHVDLIVVDVSFISLSLVVPNLIQFFNPSTDLITLIKPQFEVGPEHVEKGGIVKNELKRIECIERLKCHFSNIGIDLKDWVESPIKGTKGNTEYLALWKKY